MHTFSSPLTVGHLHGLQFGVCSSVEALHLLLLQTLQQADGVLVDAASLGQHQRGGAVVITVKEKSGQTAVLVKRVKGTV